MANEQQSNWVGSTPKLVNAAGAIDLAYRVHNIESGGAIALTLADGTHGDEKIIYMSVDGGDATLTPATFANGTTITFADANDVAHLIYDETVGWISINGTAGGVAIA